MTARTYYWSAGIILALLLGASLWCTTQSWGEDPNPQSYLYMSPSDRLVEKKALQAELGKVPNALEPMEYFRVIKRIRNLQETIKRARLEENVAKHTGPRGIAATFADDLPSLIALEDDYVRVAQRKMVGDWQAIAFAQKRFGFDKVVGHSMPAHPMLLRFWALFYFIGMFFSFGHFLIRFDAMGSIALPGIRFLLWLAIWPVGVFSYPTEIDVKQQLIRCYRVATLVVTSCLSFGAAGCAGKRVKSGPDKKEAPYAFHMHVATTTWPTYIGSNGAVFHPAAVQQTSATVPLPHGFYLGVWHSAPLGGRDLKPNYAIEIDLSGGWSGKTKGFGLSLDTTYVGGVPLKAYPGDVIQFTGSVNRSLDIGHGQTFTPYSTMNYAMPTTNNTPRRGIFFREGMRWGWQKGLWSGGANAELAHDSGAFGFKSGFFSQGGASIGKKFGKHWHGEVPLRWVKPSSKLNDGRKNEFQAGFTLAYSK